jgi:flagella basal body P-ring formation protein FlgA
MIIRSAFIALLLTGTALATPVLKSEITVTDAIVTVGDMFDDAGISAESPLFRAPLPGTSGLVQITDIRAATARIGIEAFDSNGLDAVRVSRAATIVDQAVLTNLINADLAARGIISPGMSADTIFTTPISPINAEAVSRPASVIALRYLPGTGAFSARFAIAGFEQPLDVTGNIEMMIEAPHLTANLPAGTILGPDNIDMRPIPLRFAESTGIARLEDLVGKALNRPSRDGMMLKAADVSAPLTISKNDLVTIYFRKGPMTLTVKGQAVTGATIGGPVQVINLMSKRVISATALAAGAVEVSNDPLALAGL